MNLKKIKKGQHKIALAASLMCSILVSLVGCRKPGDDPDPIVENPTGCAIASDVDEALGLRNFEYDDKGHLVKMTGPNYYYGPFVRIITSTNAADAYPTSSVDGNGNHHNGNINIFYNYTGGSGNLYDGNPEYLSESFISSNPATKTLRDSVYQFKYDDSKKHLTKVLLPGTGSYDDNDFVLFRFELIFSYDANENVNQVKIMYDWSKKTVVYPSGESRIDYLQTSNQTLNITYDNKPSPYTAISKYWKFIGEDFSGFEAYNLDKLRFWVGRFAILSKNNPVGVTGKLILTSLAAPSDIDATITYEYNEKNLPVSMAIDGQGKNAFTYNCK